MSRAWKQPTFTAAFSILNDHWFIHLSWMRTLDASTSKLGQSMLASLFPAYNGIGRLCEEVV